MCSKSLDFKVSLLERKCQKPFLLTENFDFNKNSFGLLFLFFEKYELYKK